MMLKRLWLILGVAMALGACSDEYVAGSRGISCPEGGLPMAFDSAKPCYGDEAAREWADGDCLQLSFTSVDEQIPGSAVYSGGNWTVSWAGELALTGGSTVSVRYVDNTALYANDAAAYSFDGHKVKLSGHLSPVSSAIRIKGSADDAGKYVMVKSGILNYTLQFHDDGNGGAITDYVYSTEWGETLSVINVDELAAYDLDLTGSTLTEPGHRDSVTLPTENNHEGWTSGSAFTKKCASHFSYGSSGFLLERNVSNAVYKVTLSHFGDMGYNYNIKIEQEYQSVMLVEISAHDGKEHHEGETWQIPISTASNTLMHGHYNYLILTQTGGAALFYFEVDLIAFYDE